MQIRKKHTFSNILQEVKTYFFYPVSVILRSIPIEFQTLKLPTVQNVFAPPSLSKNTHVYIREDKGNMQIWELCGSTDCSFAVLIQTWSREQQEQLKIPLGIFDKRF
jgi:hypothetical protein